MELYLHSHIPAPRGGLLSTGAIFTRPIIYLIQKQTSHQFGNKLFEIHYDATDIAIYKCLLKVGIKKIEFILFLPVINDYTELHLLLQHVLSV